MRTNPNDRPDFLELRKKTREEIKGVEKLVGTFKGLSDDELPDHLKLIYWKDEFVVGDNVEIPVKRRKSADGGKPGKKKKSDIDEHSG